ncbi:unnamed protein product [Paramecium primaurelia]|uniref:Alpha/beta hydrolase fold-3 domain-containing protein n=1 Tax=Paramecium primaurelia TaxID=5886 RepID=A0A8S1L8M5_PARPR|nr:unnamed protein product [Paramecium primaurelia]
MKKVQHSEGMIDAIYYLQKCQLIMKHFNTQNPDVIEWLFQLDETQKQFEQNQCHHPLLEQCAQFINHKIIHPFLLCLEQVLQFKNFEQELQKHKLEIDYVIRRLQIIREFMPNISKVPLDDIYCLSNTHQEWAHLAKYIQFIDLDDPEILDLQFEKFNDYISVGCAYAKLGNMIKLPVFSMIFQNLGGAFLITNIEKARQIKLKEMTNPSVKFIQNLWSIQDKAPVLKNFMKYSMTKIQSHHKIYVPYLFKPTFTLERINQEIESGTLFQQEEFKGFDLIDENLYEKLIQSLFRKDRQNKIKVRVLSANKEVFRSKIDEELIVKQIANISKDHNNIFEGTSPGLDGKIKKVILQIHGGGWVGMSSFSHQTYTRKWANHIGEDCVIFSIDYRLAPKYPYPYALEDVWQLYLWILYFSKFYMNINLEQLILAGDSAGGNMALGICFRAIKMGIKVPDGLFLPYPVVNLNFKVFNPYLLNGLIDQIAPTTILVVVLREYLNSGKEHPDTDPYLSPIIADDSFLTKLPKMRIICGAKDSLTGDTIRFVNKMRKLHHDIKLDIFNCLSHGFMNFEVPIVGVTHIGSVINISCKMVQELFKSSEVQ